MGQEAVTVEATEGPAARVRDRWYLVLLALFITLLNAIKPLTVDDSVYSLFAVHIAEHPLDPYGFRAWGIQEANSILAPPVFLYWWALGVRLFGMEPLLWKLWLLPFSLLLVFTLHALGRRFARGMEMPFVCTVVLSAAVLPCLNLMLDVPALALSLFAVVLFLRACDAGSLSGAVAAGLVAGVATQTKYTAFVAPGVMLLHALLSGKWRLGLIASSLTVVLFVGWEVLMARRYGESHFVLGCLQLPPSGGVKLKLIQPLFGYLGSTMAAGIPLGLAALGRPRRVVWAAVLLVALGFGLVAFLPSPAAASAHRSPAWSSVVFGVFGLVLAGTVAASAWRLLRHPSTAEGLPARSRWSSVDGFLVLWLVLEIAGYFALSPYPATRRILGVVVLACLLACRLAAQTCRGRRGLVWGVAGLNLALGLLAFAVDFDAYRGQQVVAGDLARECRQQDPAAKVWFFGNGAFEFYGERRGMKRLVTPDAAVSPGDWVLVVGGFEPEYARHPVHAHCVPQRVREWDSVLPLRSQYQFGSVALTRHEDPLLRVAVYRVR